MHVRFKANRFNTRTRLFNCKRVVYFSRNSDGGVDGHTRLCPAMKHCSKIGSRYLPNRLFLFHFEYHGFLRGHPCRWQNHILELPGGPKSSPIGWLTFWLPDWPFFQLPFPILCDQRQPLISTQLRFGHHTPPPKSNEYTTPVNRRFTGRSRLAIGRRPMSKRKVG